MESRGHEGVGFFLFIMSTEGAISMHEPTNSISRRELGSQTKDRSQFSRVLMDCVRTLRIDPSETALVVGGSFQDVEILQRVGFRDITLSNFAPVSCSSLPSADGLNLKALCEDAENSALANDSRDFVLAHEVLHHCRSPHRALVEMLRVSRRYVVILEPNDSLFMKALVKARLSFPYELPAVIYHNFESGGVRDSCVPNFIYRWNTNEIFKTVSSFIPERTFEIHARPYWDFNVDTQDLALRQETRLSLFMRALGAERFLRLLRLLQRILNFIPVVRRQGNKFFCCVKKKDQLQSWLIWEQNQIVFNRTFSAEKPDTPS